MKSLEPSGHLLGLVVLIKPKVNLELWRLEAHVCRDFYKGFKIFFKILFIRCN